MKAAHAPPSCCRGSPTLEGFEYSGAKVRGGGEPTIADSQIEQGPKSQNPNIIAFGEEGNLHPGSKLTVQGSLIENDLQSSSAVGVWNAGPTAAHLVNTKVGRGEKQMR